MDGLSLHDLPRDLLESLLVVQPATTVVAVSSTSKYLRTVASSPQIWRAISLREFGSTFSDSSPTFGCIAKSLECAWWAASGTLVRGLPVHFRRRFVAVRERGSTSLVRIRRDEDHAALVMGAPDGVHAPPPALEMDFAFDHVSRSKPFPMNGMTLRITGAPVPTAAPTPHSPPRSPTSSSPLSRSPGNSWNTLPRPSVSYSSSPPRLPTTSVLRAAAKAANAMLSDHDHEPNITPSKATVRVLLNGAEIGVHTVENCCAFESFDCDIPAKSLRRKPQMNTLAVEYLFNQSDTGVTYWLKHVHISPSTLPLGPPPVIANVPLRHVGKSTHGSHGQVNDNRGANAYSHFNRILGC